MKVEACYDWGKDRAIVRRVSNGIELHVEVDQLQIPEQYKALEILYG